MDQGTGVEDADKQRIFEPFWRAQAQRSDGAGLGLSIVREVAELHGGQIKVEDAPGGGALFRLTLPKEALAGRPVRRRRLGTATNTA
jgi:signal transduction histidine kinase